MAHDYDLDPEYIAIPAIASALHRAGYRQRVKYHQIYYAVSTGNLGAAQDRTSHWFLPRHRLHDLARVMKLRQQPVAAPHLREVPTAHSPSDLPSEAARDLLDSACARADVDLDAETHSNILSHLTEKMGAVEDTGHKHWPGRVVHLVTETGPWLNRFLAKYKARIESECDDVIEAAA